MKSKIKGILLFILSLVLMRILANIATEYVLFPDKGTFNELTFAKLDGVEYYSVSSRRILEGKNPGDEIERIYSNSREDEDINKVRDIFKDIKLKETRRSRYYDEYDYTNSYIVSFVGNSEKKTNQNTKYIFRNMIKIELTKNKKYMEIVLDNGDDFKEEYYYEVIEGDIDFEALDAFIEENKKER